MVALLPYAFIFVLVDFFYTTDSEWYYYLWLPLLVGYIYIDKTPINVPVINYIILVLVANYINNSGIGFYWTVMPILGYIANNL